MKMKAKQFDLGHNLRSGSASGVSNVLGYPPSQIYLVPQASNETPIDPMAGVDDFQPTTQTENSVALEPQKREFYDYMRLNPIVLKTIEQVTGRSFAKTSNKAMGDYPELTGDEADAVMRRLYNALPRQPDCPKKRCFSTVTTAYSAGVIDGEGHVSTVRAPHKKRRHPGHRIVMSISQNNHHMLEAVHNCLGAHGKFYSVGRHIGQNKECYELRYDGVHAIAALAQVYPHLIRKRRVALMLLKMFADGRLWEHVGARGVDPIIRKRRAKLHTKIKLMR